MKKVHIVFRRIATAGSVSRTIVLNTFSSREKACAEIDRLQRTLTNGEWKTVMSLSGGRTEHRYTPSVMTNKIYRDTFYIESHDVQ